MNESQSILGFTEAELGFFLALLCIVLWVVSMSVAKNGKEDRPSTISSDSLKALKARADSAARLKQLSDSLARELAVKSDSLRKLKSRIPPSCVDVKRATGPLAEIEVRSGGEIFIDGKKSSLDAFDRETVERRTADSTCMHQVRIRFSTELRSESESVRMRLSQMRIRPIIAKPLPSNR
jgi:hypothetical protein